ncbi:MAG: DUF3822 family protein [Bacteroidota bacterium]|nr:DUF3822 family protein [Bacteroidota bacterium]
MGTGANNIAPKVNYSPSNIDNLLTEKCHLSVEVGRNHFTYTLFDTLTLTYVLLRDFDFDAKDIGESTKKIEDIISEEPLFRKEFYSSSLAFVHFPSTLVPTAFYRQEDGRKVLSFNHKIYDEICAENLQQMDAVTVYSVPSELLNLVINRFPNTQIKCGSTIMIEHLLLQNESKEKVCVSVKNDIIEIVVIKDNKLIIHNCFAYDTKEDVLYYLLFVFEQLGFSPEKTDLILFDDILKSDETYQLLYDYVRNISFGSRPNNLNYADNLTELKQHQYYGLFSQLLCA